MEPLSTFYFLHFIQVLLLLPVIIVSVFHTERLNSKMLITIISPVFLFSLYLLFQHQIPSLQELTQSLLSGLILGCIIFSLSIFITEESIFTYITNFQAFLKIKFKHFKEWDSILYISFMVLYEELIWRVFLIEILFQYLHEIPVILISSFLFYYSHADQRVFNRQSADLFIFSLILTIIYFYTLNFLLVFLIHWVRNMLIVANSIGANELKKSLLND